MDAVNHSINFFLMDSFKSLSKVVFKLSSAVEFLNNISCNEITTGTNAFLDRFGKVIVVFEQYIDGSDVYCVVEMFHQKRFLDRINEMNKVSKITVEKTDYKVVHVLKGDAGKFRIPKQIGYYAIIDSAPEGKELSNEEYELLRIENNMPQQGVDFDKCMFLEADMYDAVSFTKGCYVGQEIIARVHNLGKPPRKLARIIYDKLPEKVTSKGEEIGNITSKAKKDDKWIVFAMIKNQDASIDGGEIVE